MNFKKVPETNRSDFNTSDYLSSYFNNSDFNSSDFVNSTEDNLISTPFLYIETPTIFRPPSAVPGAVPFIASKTEPPIYLVASSFPTSYDRAKDYTKKKFNTPSGFIIAVCLAFVNFFFPIIKRTVCDVSIEQLTALMRVYKFALRVFYFVDQDSIEMVNATIKCIEIPTDKRNYQPTLIAVIAVLLIAFLTKYGRRIWTRYNNLPLPRTFERIEILFPNLCGDLLVGFRLLRERFVNGLGIDVPNGLLFLRRRVINWLRERGFFG